MCRFVCLFVFGFVQWDSLVEGREGEGVNKGSVS